VILTTIEPVIMVNEVAGLDRGVNPATAEATQVWQIDANGPHALLLTHPPLALGLLHAPARRNRALLSHVEDLSFRSVSGRAARLLLELSHEGQQPIDRRRHPNADLAARIATVPQALSRSLQTFRRQGVISTTRTAILVLDAAQLRRWGASVPRTLRADTLPAPPGRGRSFPSRVTKVNDGSPSL
jgi:CRP-like cAMP-binding protein